MEIENIRQMCKQGKVRYTHHILLRLLQRNIDTDDVEHVLMHGEIIETYPTDTPYPSCLVFGADRNEEILHVVCGIAPEELWLITAYRPDIEEWESDFKTRKEKKS